MRRRSARCHRRSAPRQPGRAAPAHRRWARTACRSTSWPRRPRPAAPRDGLDLRRSVQHGLVGDAGLRRARARPAGDLVYVSFNYRLGALGFLDSPAVRDGGAAVRLEPRDPRPGRGAGVGARQHRRVRRRPRQRHDLRRVRGWNRGRRRCSPCPPPAACSTGRSPRALHRPPPTRPTRAAGWAAQLVGLLGADEKDAASALLTAESPTPSSGPRRRSTAGRTRRRRVCCASRRSSTARSCPPTRSTPPSPAPPTRSRC